MDLKAAVNTLSPTSSDTYPGFADSSFSLRNTSFQSLPPHPPSAIILAVPQRCLQSDSFSVGRRPHIYILQGGHSRRLSPIRSLRFKTITYHQDHHVPRNATTWVSEVNPAIFSSPVNNRLTTTDERAKVDQLACECSYAPHKRTIHEVQMPVILPKEQYMRRHRYQLVKI